MVFGDSISAGYGLSDLNSSWVSLLRNALALRSVTVANASISGDTTLGGVSRIEQALKQFNPEVVLVELGGNDGLRGLTPEDTRQNLVSIVRRCQQVGARVLLLGMRIPPNYGKQYADLFAAIYPKVAADTKAPLVKFFLEGVAGNPDLMQLDGIHPNEKAQQALMSAALKGLEPLLPKNTPTGRSASPKKSGGG